MKSYIITFDTNDESTFDYDTLHNTLITTKGISNWWHYLHSTYIVITNDNITASTISNYLLTIMPNKNFFTAEINLKNHNGWLPQEAWDWINTEIN